MALARTGKSIPTAGRIVTWKEYVLRLDLGCRLGELSPARLASLRALFGEQELVHWSALNRTHVIVYSDAFEARAIEARSISAGFDARIQVEDAYSFRGPKVCLLVETKEEQARVLRRMIAAGVRLERVDEPDE